MFVKRNAVVGVLGPVVVVLAVLSMGPVAPPQVGDPLPGVTDAERAAWLAGRDAFETAEGPEEGLGPVFNEDSCVACHFAGATGGGSDRTETRFGRIIDGRFDPMASSGGSLIQDHGIGGPYYDAGGNPVTYVAEVIPPGATVVAGRRTTPLFGLGLVEGVPDQTLLDLQLQTGGRANLVLDVASNRMRVGRFGWKCQQATLRAFSADAYLNEMGITTPPFPDSLLGFNNESEPQGDGDLLAANPGPSLGEFGVNDDGFDDVDAFADFMTFLAPLPRGPATGQVRVGEALFLQVGCAVCHVPSLTTGASASAALDRRTFFAYSDFLLHDMGTLNDGIAQGEAGTNEMRTAPLWGVRLLKTLLHDGSADTIPGAILRHDGQGRAARDRFAALNQGRQKALVAFLESL